MKSRRDFLRVAAIGAAASLPAGSLALRSTPAVAQDLPRLELDDAAAMALGYVHDASEVDPGRFPRFVEGQDCSNCILIQGEEAEWRPCAIFPGKLVANDGWCSAWVPKN